MEHICGGCGKPTWNDGLCNSCEYNRKRQEYIAEDTRRAAQQAAYAAERQDERERKREKREKEERKLAILRLFLTYSDDVKSIFRSVDNTDEGKLEALQRISKIFIWVNDSIEESLEKLHATSPLDAELAYTRLRKVLAPFVVGFWKIRHRFPAPSIGLLQNLARCVMYTDISEVKLVLQEEQNRAKEINLYKQDRKYLWSKIQDKEEEISRFTRTGVACIVVIFLTLLFSCLLTFWLLCFSGLAIMLFIWQTCLSHDAQLALDLLNVDLDRLMNVSRFIPVGTRNVSGGGRVDKLFWWLRNHFFYDFDNDPRLHNTPHSRQAAGKTLEEDGTTKEFASNLGLQNDFNSPLCDGLRSALRTIAVAVIYGRNFGSIRKTDLAEVWHYLKPLIINDFSVEIDEQLSCPCDIIDYVPLRFMREGYKIEKDAFEYDEEEAALFRAERPSVRIFIRESLSPDVIDQELLAIVTNNEA